MAAVQDTDLRPQDWTLFDKIMYGGFGYSQFCLPDNILIISLTIIYPPLGLISWLVKDTFTRTFPYITSSTFIKLFRNLEIIFYSIIYTMFLYIPGIIYTFNNTIYNNNDK